MSYSPEKKIIPTVVDDLLLRESDWVNIQSIIRLSLKGLADVVRVQGNSIRDLQRELPSKVSQSEFLCELNTKAEYSQIMEHLNDFKKEVRSNISDISLKIAEKLNLSDLQSFFSDKASLDQCETIVSRNMQKFQTFIENHFTKYENFQKQCSHDVDHLKNEVNSRIKYKEFESNLQRLEEKFSEDILVIQESFKKQTNSKADFEQVYKIEEFQKDLEMVVANLQNDFLNGSEKNNLKLENLQEYSKKLLFFSESTKEKLNSFEKSQFHLYSESQKTNENLTLFNEKSLKRIESLQIYIDDLKKEIEHCKIFMQDINGRKPERDELYEKIDEIRGKVSSKIDEIDFYNSFQSLTSTVSEKTPLPIFEKFVNSLNENMEQIQKDLILKGNIKDICILLDSKPGIDEINQALTQIHNELDSKASETDLNKYVASQKTVNSVIISENIVGRWTWSSGNLLRSNLVPWEKQVVNSSAESFLWEENAGFVLITKSGYYEVAFGFFSGKKCNAQLMVNGEITISAINNSVYSVQGSTGKLRMNGVTGISVHEFINVPNRSRISIALTGEPGEGFLTLRKL